MGQRPHEGVLTAFVAGQCAIRDHAGQFPETCPFSTPSAFVTPPSKQKKGVHHKKLPLLDSPGPNCAAEKNVAGTGSLMFGHVNRGFRSVDQA